jgi:hypothetical protein
LLPHLSPEPPLTPAAPGGCPCAAPPGAAPPGAAPRQHPHNKYLDLTNLPFRIAVKISTPST